MKKIKFESIEVLGYIGILIWGAVIALRGNLMLDNTYYKFLLGVLPNLGAAWSITMFGKWMIELKLKREYNRNMHLIICLSILVFAFISEIIHHLFLNSPFDIYDMITTIIAQIVMFVIPIIRKNI